MTRHVQCTNGTILVCTILRIGDFVSDSKVVPFRRRPPSKTELDVYKSMTRLWSSEMRQRIFPEHFRAIRKDADDKPRNIKL